jgi:flagellar biogenesis protein FliO
MVMIAPLLFMQLMVPGTPTTIAQVTAAREAGRLAVTVKGDATIDPEAARTRMVDGRLYLFVQDARVREANRAWPGPGGEEAEPIRAHRHRHEVELVVPLGGSGCEGPVELQSAAGGLQALITCSPTSPRPAPQAKADRPSATAGDAPRAAAALKAAIALDAEPAAPARRPAHAATADQAPAQVPAPPATEHHAVASVAPARPDTAVPSPAPSASASSSVSASAPPSASSSQSASSPSTAPHAATGGVFFAGFVLIALAAAAFFLTRRRAKVGRLVKIIESTSLGPKRAIVVARIGESTMILGSSEAGITLLQTLPAAASRGAAVAGEIAVAPSVPDTRGVPAEAAADDSFHLDVVDETEAAGDLAAAATGAADAAARDAADAASPGIAGQGGLLARLFGRGKPANDAPMPRFEDLLEDSFEDQELRRKLSLGLAGRVR